MKPYGYDEFEDGQAGKEGQRAYERGGARDENPYKGQDPRRLEWLVGYNDAQNADMAVTDPNDAA